jgi:hypothetical protein
VLLSSVHGRRLPVQRVVTCRDDPQRHHHHVLNIERLQTNKQGATIISQQPTWLYERCFVRSMRIPASTTSLGRGSHDDVPGFAALLDTSYTGARLSHVGDTCKPHARILRTTQSQGFLTGAGPTIDGTHKCPISKRFSAPQAATLSRPYQTSFSGFNDTRGEGIRPTRRGRNLCKSHQGKDHKR